MKSKDSKRGSQQTSSTCHPTVSFHLDSHSQERIPCGQKVCAFSKIKIESVLRNKAGWKELCLAKENNPREEVNVNYSERDSNVLKHREERSQSSRRHSVNVSTHRPSKAVSSRVKNGREEGIKIKARNPPKPKSKKTKPNGTK